MRSLANKTNVVAAGGQYPYGRVKDETTPGAYDGTPVDEELLGDIMQFFEHLMNEAGLTPDENPDNTGNNFQLFQALREMSVHIKFKGFTKYTLAGNLPTTVISSTYYRMEFPTLTVEMTLSSSPSLDVVSFGNSMPKGTSFLLKWTTGSGVFTITLNSTNAGSFPIITHKDYASNNSAYTIIANSVIRVTRFDSEWRISEIEDTDT